MSNEVENVAAEAAVEPERRVALAIVELLQTDASLQDVSFAEMVLGVQIVLDNMLEMVYEISEESDE